MVRFAILNVLVLLFVLPTSVLTKEHKPTHLEPLDHGYVGIHGMVLFNHGRNLYASHMPLYRKPHNAQIIYQIETQHDSLLKLVKNTDMVTVKPELFNLQRLINGEAMSVNVDVYNGHFEREGSLQFKDIEIILSKQVYLRILEDISPASVEKKYDDVTLDNGGRLLVYQIQSAPSFDHILMLADTSSCPKTINTKTLVPEDKDLNALLDVCGSLKSVYFETQDFKKRSH